MGLLLRFLRSCTLRKLTATYVGGQEKLHAMTTEPPHKLTAGQVDIECKKQNPELEGAKALSVVT